jgi:hypothetical protein
VSPSALILPIVTVALGVAILVRTIVAGGGALAFGILLGILFIVAGALRLLLERRR